MTDLVIQRQNKKIHLMSEALNLLCTEPINCAKNPIGGCCFIVSPAKHCRHIGIMTLAALSSSSALSHFWFPIDNY